jgi:hypothetical protein
MGKIVYVNGNIIVQTQYFLPKDVGCGYATPPEGTTMVIEPEDEVEGIKCLLIDDDHPQSLFNEYYAKDGVSTDSIVTSYLAASYLDSINEYKKRIGETCDLVNKVSEWEDSERTLVYKMAYVNILTALDAFICYVLLKRSLQDEIFFKAVMFKLAPGSKKEQWLSLINNGCDGEWEQDAIRFVQETSFLNTDKIDKAFKHVKFDRLEYDRKEVERFFRIRHLLVHRSGLQRDDTYVAVTYNLLAKLVNAAHTLVGAIFDSICITLDREMRDKPQERDLEEVFPGGVVRAPFKLSDLARLHRSGEEQKPFEPIQMPVL